MSDTIFVGPYEDVDGYPMQRRRADSGDHSVWSYEVRLDGSRLVHPRLLELVEPSVVERATFVELLHTLNREIRAMAMKYGIELEGAE